MPRHNSKLFKFVKLKLLLFHFAEAPKSGGNEVLCLSTSVIALIYRAVRAESGGDLCVLELSSDRQIPPSLISDPHLNFAARRDHEDGSIRRLCECDFLLSPLMSC